MVTDPIAELRSPVGALISMYVERPSPGGFRALITDLGRGIRKKVAVRDRSIQKSVDSDLERIRNEAEGFELEAIPAYAIFASSVDGIFEVKPLAHPVSSTAVLGSRPYLRPLRATPRPLRTGVLVADKSEARVFVGQEGSIEEVGAALQADQGKGNYGGFSGYDEHTVRSRAEEIVARLWREAGQRLLDRHLDTPLDSLLVGGHAESIDDIRGELHPYLQELPGGSCVLVPSGASKTRLRGEIDALNSVLREKRERHVIEELLAAAGSDGRGVLGLAEVLDAANVQSISDLVVAGDFSRPGVMCPECGYLARVASECRVCGSGVHEVDDVVAALIDATIGAGGSVHQVLVGSALDKDGVGALTRFKIHAVE